MDEKLNKKSQIPGCDILGGCNPCGSLEGCNPLGGGCDLYAFFDDPLICITQIPDYCNSCFACLPGAGATMMSALAWAVTGISSLVMLTVSGTLSIPILISVILVMSIILSLMYKMK